MIRTAGQMLDALLARERVPLDASSIKHGTTIGGMYEHLSREALAMSIPAAAELSVAEGFIRDSRRKLSGQQDVMLVLGAGESVPRSASRIYDAENVIATIEVKKNLYAKDVRDAVESLSGVLDLDLDPGWDYWDTFRNAFRRIVRRPLPSSPDHLPSSYRALYHLIERESAFPLRIVFGHHGFASEQSARRGLVALFAREARNPAFAPAKLPSLILNKDVAIAKTLGSPWYLPMDHEEGSTCLLATTGRRSTGTVLLDRIWARLCARGLVPPHYFGADRWAESWTPLVTTRFVPGRGWENMVFDGYFPESSSAFDAALQPIEVNEDQLVAITWLCGQGSLDVSMFEGQSPSRETMVENLEYLSAHGMVAPRWDDPNIWELLLPAIGFWFRPGETTILSGDNTNGQLTHVSLKAANVRPDQVLVLSPTGDGST